MIMIFGIFIFLLAAGLAIGLGIYEDRNKKGGV